MSNTTISVRKAIFFTPAVELVLLSIYCGGNAIGLFLIAHLTFEGLKHDMRIVSASQSLTLESARQQLGEEGVEIWTDPKRESKIERHSNRAIRFSHPRGHTLNLEVDRESNAVTAWNITGRYSDVNDLYNAIKEVNYYRIWAIYAMADILCVLPIFLWYARNRIKTRSIRLALEVSTGIASISSFGTTLFLATFHGSLPY